MGGVLLPTVICKIPADSWRIIPPVKRLGRWRNVVGYSYDSLPTSDELAGVGIRRATPYFRVNPNEIFPVK